MSQFFIGVKSLLVCSILALPMFVFSDCKAPRRGPPGPVGEQGIPAPIFEAAQASRYLADAECIDNGTDIPFRETFNEAENLGITYSEFSADGDSDGCLEINAGFNFERSGFYEITFGARLSPETDNAIIALRLNGNVVDGTTLFFFEDSWSHSLTVILEINAGDRLTVSNTSAGPLRLAPYSDGISAFISISEINPA